MKINKLVIITLILSVVFSSIVLAVDSKYDKFKPKWYESWEGARGGPFSNFFHNMIPFVDYEEDMDLSANADHLGWYNKTTFGLSKWEEEVCLMDLSTDITLQTDEIDIGDSTRVYRTTITASALYNDNGYGTSYYEASWYIHPFDEGLEYRVFLEKGSVKEFLVGNKNSESGFVDINSQTGASGYVVKTMNQTFTKIVVEYRAEESTDVKTYSVGVIQR